MKGNLLRRLTQLTDKLTASLGVAMAALYYTGTGVYDTPVAMQVRMTKLAGILEQENWTLRTGGGNGAEQAWSRGATWPQVYLPWRNYNFQPGSYVMSAHAYDLVKDTPKWDQLTFGAQAIHAAQACMVLGVTLDKPSHFLITYMPNGSKLTPGTGTTTAQRLADQGGIPVFNLAVDGDDKRFWAWFKDPARAWRR